MVHAMTSTCGKIVALEKGFKNFFRRGCTCLETPFTHFDPGSLHPTIMKQPAGKSETTTTNIAVQES
jgi:hypothetical protein